MKKKWIFDLISHRAFSVTNFYIMKNISYLFLIFALFFSGCLVTFNDATDIYYNSLNDGSSYTRFAQIPVYAAGDKVSAAYVHLGDIKIEQGKKNSYEDLIKLARKEAYDHGADCIIDLNTTTITRKATRGLRDKEPEFYEATVLTCKAVRYKKDAADTYPMNPDKDTTYLYEAEYLKAKKSKRAKAQVIGTLSIYGAIGIAVIVAAIFGK